MYKLVEELYDFFGYPIGAPGRIVLSKVVVISVVR